MSLGEVGWYWARIGEDPPHAWTLGLRPGMRVLDIENSLCWCHRYINDFERKKFGNLAELSHPIPNEMTELASESAWCEEEKHDSRLETDDDERPTEIDGVYEVEKIVGRKGNRTDRDGLFRVRWKGYLPEDDTWERASSLKDGAKEVSIDSQLCEDLRFESLT